jgi:uncharacterized membrane protein YkoI
MRSELDRSHDRFIWGFYRRSQGRTFGRHKEEPMKRKFAVAAALVVGAGAASGGAAIAAGGDDDATETPITASALDKATAAALEQTGGGRVTGTEVGDEESYYEVEVTLDDGRQVDVQLDKSFNVVSSEGDREEPGEN